MWYSKQWGPWTPKMRPLTSLDRSLARKSAMGATASAVKSSGTEAMSSVMRVRAIGAMALARTP